MNLQSLTDTDKAELNTRLCAIDIVSWQWNEKGLAIHRAEKRYQKLKNEPEIGVLAQTIQDKLQDLFPDIVPIHPTGALMVNYGLLGEIALHVLKYLDKTNPRPQEMPSLKSLLEKYKTDDPQLYATRLLALVKKYNQSITQQSHPTPASQQRD